MQEASFFEMLPKLSYIAEVWNVKPGFLQILLSAGRLMDISIS
jgi:hypothetical protein